MSIMRPSHKQHVRLLPDDVSRGPKLSRPLSCVASLHSDQHLSSYYINALASRLSPYTRTSAVTIPRQLAPIVGPAHDGVEFLEGSLLGIEELTNFWMKKSRAVCVVVVSSQSAESETRSSARGDLSAMLLLRGQLEFKRSV